MTFWYLLQKRELKRWYQQQNAEKKELNKRYMLHLPRATVVRMLDKMTTKHKHLQTQVEDMHRQMKQQKTTHGGALLTYKAEATLDKYTEVSEKRDTLQRQVKMLQAALRANKSPHHLRAVIETIVSGGSSEDDVSVVSQVQSQPQENFVPPRFLSHSEKKTEDTVKQIEMQVKDRVINAKQGETFLKKLKEEGKLNTATVKEISDVAEKEFEKEDKDRQAGKVAEENAALRKNLADMKVKLQTADESEEMEKAEEKEEEKEHKEEDEEKKEEKSADKDDKMAAEDEQADMKKVAKMVTKKALSDHKTLASKLVKAAGKVVNTKTTAKKTHAKSHIKTVVEDFSASKAKVAAARAEVLTLRARKAEMQKESIKGALKTKDGTGGGKGGHRPPGGKAGSRGGNNNSGGKGGNSKGKSNSGSKSGTGELRESYESTEAGLKQAQIVRDYLKDNLDGPGQSSADLGESSGVQEVDIADRLSALNRILRLRETQYRSMKRDLALRARKIKGMLA